MSNILFTADWHIKLGQKNVPAGWASRRYLEFFHQVHNIKCDLHIIGGDLFDRLPTMEELELFFIFIANIKVPTIIFDGNHEATKKNQTFFDFLQGVTQNLNPLVEVQTNTTFYPGHDFWILPYCDLHKKSSIKEIQSMTEYPVFTHVRGEIPPHVKPEIDLDLLKDFPVVFAGDLHSHSNTQRNIVYPVSPMTTSFHRNELTTGYLMIDGNNWNWKFHEFELPQLIRKTVQSTDEMIATDYHHTIYELEGDMQDLAGVKNSELLDKKVVKRSSEATLLLDSSMSLEDELVEYLTYILELDERKISNVIGTYHDYSQKIAME